MVNPVPYEDFQLTTTWDAEVGNWLYALALTELAYEFNRRMTSIGQTKIAFAHVGTGDNADWWQNVAGVSPIKVWHDLLTEMYAEFNLWKGAGNYYDETRYIDATHYGTVRWESGADTTTTTFLSQLATKKTLDIIYQAYGEMKTAINNMFASHEAWGYSESQLSVDVSFVETQNPNPKYYINYAVSPPVPADGSYATNGGLVGSDTDNYLEHNASRYFMTYHTGGSADIVATMSAMQIVGTVLSPDILDDIKYYGIKDYSKPIPAYSASDFNSVSATLSSAIVNTNPPFANTAEWEPFARTLTFSGNIIIYPSTWPATPSSVTTRLDMNYISVCTFYFIANGEEFSVTISPSPHETPVTETIIGPAVAILTDNASTIFGIYI